MVTVAVTCSLLFAVDAPEYKNEDEMHVPVLTRGL